MVLRASRQLFPKLLLDLSSLSGLPSWKVELYGRRQHILGVHSV